MYLQAKFRFLDEQPSRDIPNFLALHKKGLLPVDRMISHTLELAEINVAMERLAEGQAVRQIICF